MVGYLFGGDTGITYEQLQKMRRATPRRNMGAPINALAGFAMGLPDVVDGIKSGIADRRERKATERDSAAFSDILAALNAPDMPAEAPAAESPMLERPSPIGDAFPQEAASPQPAAAPAQGALDPRIIEAVIKQESGGNPNAVSPKGAQGLMQIMPATARDPGYGVPNIFDTARQMGRNVPDESDATKMALLRDEEVNRAFGTNYLGAMGREFGGDQEKMLAAYNAGPGAVQKFGGVPPYDETQNYVRSITSALNAQGPQESPMQAQAPMQAPQQPMPAQQPTQARPDRTAQMAQLSDLLGRGFLSPQQAKIAEALLMRELMPPQEATMTPYQQAQLEMERRRLGLAERRLEAETQRGGFRMASPEEAQQYGAGAGQFGPDGRFYPINPPSGMSVEVGPDGQMRMVQGPGAQNKPFTEGQSKDNVYATRAEGALGTLEERADALTSLGDRLLSADPTGIARGAFQSEDYQIARTAGDEFLQAILRKDTGAAITTQEQELYGQTYLPQPGDNEGVLAYKREARRRAIEAIKAGMSPSQIIAQERAMQATQAAISGDAAPAEAPAATGGPVDLETLLQRYAPQ